MIGLKHYVKSKLLIYNVLLNERKLNTETENDKSESF